MMQLQRRDEKKREILSNFCVECHAYVGTVPQKYV